jgi:hypothetical protein
MNIEIRILLYPIDKYDRRTEAEFVENNVYNIHQLETAIPNDVDIVTLSDFMDLCNNQMLDLEQYWVSYIRYNKEEI